MNLKKHLKPTLITLMIVCFLFSLTAQTFAVDQVEMPAELNEAPEFRERVEAGELPSVEERVPEEAFVLEPREEIGRYGGTLRAPVESIEGTGNDVFLTAPLTPFLIPREEDHQMVPNLAKSFTPNEDSTVWTLEMRKGVKWSDGEPFNADDIMFWYEDILQNEQLTPAIGSPWRRNIDGEIDFVDIIKVDDHTVEFHFEYPSVFLHQEILHQYTMIQPAHYLQDYHVDYVPEDELAEVVADEGFDAWYELFEYKNSNVWGVPLIEERPTLAAYKLAERTAERREYVRNPYYWKIDTAGNQLPYLDGISGEYIADYEVVHGRAISGELDFADRVGLENLPMYSAYEEEGDYVIRLYNIGRSTQAVYMVNRTDPDPGIREVHQDSRFSQALSLGFDREEFSEAFYFGQAEPAQYTVLERSQYFEPEFKEAYTDYDPERANQLLDDIGMDERDSSGYRLRPDGERYSVALQTYERSDLTLEKVELVIDYWQQELDLDISLQEISGELTQQRAPANEISMMLWGGDKGTDIMFPTGNNLVIPKDPSWDQVMWTEWGRWFQTDGDSGEEPPENVKQIRSWYEEMTMEPDEERRIELGKKILAEQAENLWVIGNVAGVNELMIWNEDLRNLPCEELTVRSWDTGLYTSTHPEQLFFDRD